MKRVNKNAYIDENVDGNPIVKVIIDNVPYKSCCLCDSFFSIANAKRAKYCPDCRRQRNIDMTTERRKKKERLANH